MKQWTPYWKGLERAIKCIHNNKAFEVDTQIPLLEWIKDLKFLQISAANRDSLNIASWLAVKSISEELFLGFGGEDHRFQLYLRCLRALDFCRGRVEKRKEFNWDRNAEGIYRELLIDDWMGGALHWVTRCHPDGAISGNKIITQLNLDPSVIQRN